MSNSFLKIDKDLFKLKLNPTEILVLSQIMEFQRTTGDCFISDKVMANSFGVSESTISRALKNLENKEFVERKTKNIKGGKERHLSHNLNKINEALTTVKLTVDNQQNEVCTTSKLTVDNQQNDLIKENIEDNPKDKMKKSEPSPKAQVPTSVVGLAAQTSDNTEERLTEITIAEAKEYWGDSFIIDGNILSFKKGDCNYGKKFKVAG